MSHEAPRPVEPPPEPTTAGRLDSWKEIALYLKRDVTTVRRWEKREGLPVHRHLHQQRESVYAFAAEIDAWWRGRGAGRDAIVDQPAGPHAPDDAALPAGSARRAWVLAAALAVAAVVSTSLLVAAQWRRPDGGGELRFPLLPPEQTSFESVSLSPDGRQVAFTARAVDGTRQLYLRSLDTLTARALAGTDDATFPFWSPDSDAIAFFAGGKLKRIDLPGESLDIVCDAPDGRGGSWNRQGTILFAGTRDGGLARVPATGGTPAPVTVVDRPRQRGHIWPEFLPDGERFLYLADSSQTEEHVLFVGGLDGRAPSPLFPLVSNAVVGDGYLFFARDRQLLAQPFDADRAVVTGDPVVVAADVLQPWSLDHKTDVSVSATGMVAFRSLRGPDTQLVWRDRAEQQSALTSSPAQFFEPTLSPDGHRVAIDVFSPRPSPRFGYGIASITSDIWILETPGGTASRFTFDPGAEFDPVWSPDGSQIAYSANRNGTLDLYRRRLDGVGGDEQLIASADPKHALTWSPDGQWLVYASQHPSTRVDLWRLPMTGDHTPSPVVRTAAREEYADISPDGRWLAYASDETGRREVYVQAFPEPAGKWQVSVGGGGDPRWRADGRELFYLAEDRQLMAVAVTTGTTFERGPAVALFDTGMHPGWGSARNHYDVSADGQRFLVMTPVADDRSSPFTVVANWAAPRP